MKFQQAAYNPLMRNRDGSNPPSQKQKSDSKSKSKRKKATGSISSESSESSSDESIDTDISSERFEWYKLIFLTPQLL